MGLLNVWAVSLRTGFFLFLVFFLFLFLFKLGSNMIQFVVRESSGYVVENGLADKSYSCLRVH